MDEQEKMQDMQEDVNEEKMQGEIDRQSEEGAVEGPEGDSKD